MMAKQEIPYGMGSFRFVAMDCFWKSYPTHLAANSAFFLGRTLQQGRRGDQGRDQRTDRRPAHSNARQDRLRPNERQVNDGAPTLSCHPAGTRRVRLSTGVSAW